jgi:hypothetical protein
VADNEVIQLTTAEGMFRYFNRITTGSADDLIDFTDVCKKIDFSKVTTASYVFDNARVKNLDVDFSSATNLTNAFSSSNGGRIRGYIHVKISDKAKTLTNIFSLNKTEEVILKEGSIIAYNISQPSPYLTKESIESFINALSSKATNKILTLNKDAVNRAFETTTGADDGESSEEWNNLVATKSNWTITLSTA